MSQDGLTIVQLSQFHIMDVDAYDDTREDLVSAVLYDGLLGLLGLYRFFSSSQAHTLHDASSSSPLSSISNGLMGSSTT